MTPYQQTKALKRKWTGINRFLKDSLDYKVSCRWDPVLPETELRITAHDELSLDEITFLAVSFGTRNIAVKAAMENDGGCGCCSSVSLFSEIRIKGITKWPVLESSTRKRAKRES